MPKKNISIKKSKTSSGQRRGRKPLKPPSEFVKLGGNKALDFANTIVHHLLDHKEYLTDPEKLGRWFELFFGASKKKSWTQRDLIFCLELRKNTRALLLSQVENCKVSLYENTVTLNEQLSAMRAHPYFSVDETQKIKMEWTVDSAWPGSEIESLIKEFGEFFNKKDLDRLKICNNPNCSHFFYDISKNRTRLWCNMKTCGNIIKARKFYKKSKVTK
jgi:predicted RNA-binding Zn ribbon-like protein